MFLSLLGGDPTGTGKGGASIYGRHFDDEIHEELKHTGKLVAIPEFISGWILKFT